MTNEEIQQEADKHWMHKSAHNQIWVEAAQWARDETIKQVCEWIEKTELFRCYPQQNGDNHFMKTGIVEELKKTITEL